MYTRIWFALYSLSGNYFRSQFGLQATTGPPPPLHLFIRRVPFAYVNRRPRGSSPIHPTMNWVNWTNFIINKLRDSEKVERAPTTAHCTRRWQWRWWWRWRDGERRIWANFLYECETVWIKHFFSLHNLETLRVTWVYIGSYYVWREDGWIASERARV